MDVPSRPELFDFHGVWMTHYFTDNWENVQNFQARPDDILISTYPKAGSTWVSYILDLLHFGQTFPERETSVPLFARIIYVARNAKDSVVSYFHFEGMLSFHPEPGDWSSYLQRFMEGKILNGSWYDHVNGWWEKKQSHPNIHYMFYEDLVEDCEREIDKLCCFLGLSPSSKEREMITRRVQFDDMKKNNMVNHSTFKGMDFKRSSFIRKGKVGDWKNHFTVAQSEKFDEDYKQKMKNSTLQFRTEV